MNMGRHPEDFLQASPASAGNLIVEDFSRHRFRRNYESAMHRFEFKVSSQLTSEYQARLIRIRCSGPNPEGPGMQESKVPMHLKAWVQTILDHGNEVSLLQ